MRAFSYCDKLVSIRLPSLLKKINDGVFENSHEIATVTIPSSVTYIGQTSFWCKKLTKIYEESIIPPQISSTCFYRDLATKNSISTLYVPIGTKTYYQNYSYWNQIGNIVEDSSLGGIAKIDGIRYFYKNGGAMIISDSLCKGYVSIPSRITVNNKVYLVTAIGQGAFKNSTDLTGISFSSNIISIGDSAFYNCTNLQSLSLPSSIRTIGENSFNGCTGLTTFEIPKSTTTFAVSAFTGCTNIKTFSVADGNTTYEAEAGIL